MDCVGAQQAISDALDREPVDAALLKAAQEHCRQCVDCARFVRGQLLLKQAQLPAVPPDLLARVKSAIRAKVAEQTTAAARTEAAQAPATSAAEAAEPPSVAETVIPDAAETETTAPETHDSSRAAAAGKPGLAATLDKHTALLVGIFLLVIAISATVGLIVFGTRQITGSGANPAFVTGATGQTPPAAGTGAAAAGAPGASTAGAGASNEATQAGPKLITVMGVVYSLDAAAAPAEPAATKVIGTTTSGLGSPQGSRVRDVRAGQSSDTVYVTDDAGQTLAFRRVTRSYLGLTFVLMSKELTDYGQWPTLPGDVAPPTTPDGSPTFLFNGADSSGVKVYRKTTQPVTSGIAIAPQGDIGGSLSADPYWTWWAASSQ